MSDQAQIPFNQDVARLQITRGKALQISTLLRRAERARKGAGISRKMQ